MRAVPPGHTVRREPASSVAPVSHSIRALPASWPRIRPSHPGDEPHFETNSKSPTRSASWLSHLSLDPGVDESPTARLLPRPYDEARYVARVPRLEHLAAVQDERANQGPPQRGLVLGGLGESVVLGYMSAGLVGGPHVPIAFVASMGIL